MGQMLAQRTCGKSIVRFLHDRSKTLPQTPQTPYLSVDYPKGGLLGPSHSSAGVVAATKCIPGAGSGGHLQASSCSPELNVEQRLILQHSKQEASVRVSCRARQHMERARSQNQRCTMYQQQQETYIASRNSLRCRSQGTVHGQSARWPRCTRGTREWFSGGQRAAGRTSTQQQTRQAREV